MARKSKTTTAQTQAPKKSKYVRKVIKELRTKGVTYKIGETYDAIEKGSLEYLQTAGYLAS